MPSAFQHSDAWVLAAVIHAGNPAALVDIVAAADAIEHAVLEPEELAGALSRLSAAGLLESNAVGVNAVGEAERLAASLHGRRVRLLSLVDRCQGVLAKHSPPGAVAIEMSGVSDAAIAIAAYRSIASAVLERLHET